MDYPIFSIFVGAGVVFLLSTALATRVAGAGFPLPPEARRIGCIDGLRGYLALSVLVHHFIIWLQVTRLGGSWKAPSIAFFNELGAGSVALFFMITGTVFYPRILAGYKASPWRAIYINRAFRILPLIVVSVAIIVCIISLRTGRGPGVADLLPAIAWITAYAEPPLLGYPDSGRLNAYVLWSLRYEWIFYLFILPACALMIDLLRTRLPSWTLPAALLTTALVMRHFAPTPLLTYLPLFAIGMLAFECRRRDQIVRLLRTPAATIAAVAALGLGMSAFPTPYEPLALLLFGYFFICVACGNSMGGVLQTSGAAVLGECSYGIYLLHGVLLSLVFVDFSAATGAMSPGALAILVLPIIAIVVVPVTLASFLLVERPAMRLGQRIVRGARLGQLQRAGAATP